MNQGNKQGLSDSKGLRRVRWVFGIIAFACCFGIIILQPPSALYYPHLPFMGFFKRAFYILLMSFSICLYRIVKGPTPPDRIVAVDILGVLIVGFCALMNITTHRSWYIDIGIAWALQSFIAALALAKYLEGRGLDE